MKDSSAETAEPTWFEEKVVEVVTDEFGQYSRTRTSYPSAGDVRNFGVQANELDSALEFFTDFVMLEVLDSPALDNNLAYEAWVQNTAPKFVDASQFDAVTSSQEQGRLFGVIFNNYGPFISYPADLGKTRFMIPVLLRDGGPRVINKKLWAIEASPISGGVHITAVGSAVLLSNFEQAILQNHEQFLTGEVDYTCVSDEQVTRQCGGDRDLLSNRYFTMRFQVALSLVPSDVSWKISSFSNHFTIQSLSSLSSDDENRGSDFLEELRVALIQGG